MVRVAVILLLARVREQTLHALALLERFISVPILLVGSAPTVEIKSRCSLHRSIGRRLPVV